MNGDIHAHTSAPQATRERNPAQALRYLIQVVGADHVFPGSHYALARGTERPGERNVALGSPGEAPRAIQAEAAGRRRLKWEGSENE